jgi:hypothetical protein
MQCTALPSYCLDFSPVESAWGVIGYGIAHECMSTDVKKMQMFCKKGICRLQEREVAKLLFSMKKLEEECWQ